MDIFSASPVDATPGSPTCGGDPKGPQLASTFAVGEEAEQPGNVFLREVGKLAAPLDRAGATFKPGATVRVDVVVRTRRIGHFFPAGTVDSFDIWLELTGTDANGKPVFWSGRVEDNGKGPVEPGAHFYRSYQLDGEGNPINKRNAFQTRSVLYVRMIPPGAADVAHYRVQIPENAKGPDHAPCQVELSQVLALLHAVLVRRRAAARAAIAGEQQLMTAAQFSFSPDEYPQECFRRDQGPHSGPADCHACGSDVEA